jgi:flavin reductase (DIM6/NTAB) family NADH-FMN oxidoreductase RutF
MDRLPIPVDRLRVPAIPIWDKRWLLLAAGDFQKKDYNCMTVGWGGFGVMWRKPIAMVAVRPTRYTMQFMEKHRSFTLSAFAEEHRAALSYCGSHSGTEGDKAKAAGLTAMASRAVPSPGFDEAELIVECRTIYSDDFDPTRFMDSGIEVNYPKKDYHRMYFGEIVSISGTSAWRED